MTTTETFISYVNGQVEADNTADDLLLLRVRIAALPAQQRQVATAEGRWVILEVHNSTKNSTAAEVVLFGTAEGESEPPIVGLQIVGPAPAKYTDLLGKISRLYREQRAPATLISAALDVALSDVEPDEIWAAAYDVGQGNCNAIVDKYQHPLVFFDLGWPPNFHSKTRPSVQPDFFACDGPLFAPVVLSHWDMDHWCYAIENSKFNRGSLTTSHRWKTSALTRFWIARAPLEVQHGIGFVAMAFYRAMKEIEIIPGVPAMLLWPEGVITIPFRFGWLEACSPGSNVPDDSNNTGLAMFVRPRPRAASILFTGDADFQSIPSLSNRIKLAGMVAPHHGGDVIGLHVPAPTKGTPARLVISVGPQNQYGHPTNAALSAYTAQRWVMSSTLNRSPCAHSVHGSLEHIHGSTLIPFRKGQDPSCGCTCVPTGSLCLLPSNWPSKTPVAGVKPPKKAKAKAKSKIKAAPKLATPAVV